MMYSNDMTITNKQAAAAVELIGIAYKLVAAAGPSGKPSGHLYVEMMSAFDGLDGYQSMINLMLRTKLLSQSGDILVAAKV